MNLNRRLFTLGAGATLLSLSTPRAFAQDAGTRSITNWIGTYDVPVNPKRVIAIDYRIDLETALALNLPVIGYCHNTISPWVDVQTDAVMISDTPNIEQILSLEPDLILCSDWGDLEGWPLQRLRDVAPVLPIKPSDGWRATIQNVSGWLDIQGRGDAAIAEFDAIAADIRARHAQVIDNKKVLALHYFPDSQNMMIRGIGSSQTHALNELGGHTIDPSIIEQGQVSMELLPDMLADIDGLLYAELADFDTFGAVQKHPQWSRIPAVAAGKVHILRGQTNFGGVYAAKYLVREWEKLYALLGA